MYISKIELLVCKSVYEFKNLGRKMTLKYQKKKGKISLLVSEWDLCTISLWRKEENKSQQNKHYHKVAQKQ